ncbi:MAG: hypothetical protein ACI8UD_001195 [Planctomycetota bacterium]
MAGAPHALAAIHDLARPHMKLLLPTVALALLFTSGCDMITIQSDAYNRNDRLAIVSLNLDGLSEGASAGETPEYIAAITAKMLGHSEQLLNRKFRVVKIATLADHYQALSFGEPFAGTYSPSVGNRAMTNFESDRKQAAKAQLSAATVDRLTEALGVDAVAVIYSKWTSALKANSDGIITNKGPGLQIIGQKLMPVVTTSLRIYRRGGDEVFQGREEIVPNKYVQSASTAVSVRESAGVRKACTNAYVEAMTKMVKHVR